MSRKKINTLLTNGSYIDAEDVTYPSNILCNYENDVEKCEIIHIGMVCAGYKSSRSVVTMLKSILFYRKHPLHFHFLVDNISERILKTLFETWDIPQGTKKTGKKYFKKLFRYLNFYSDCKFLFYKISDTSSELDTKYSLFGRLRVVKINVAKDFTKKY